MNIDQTAREMSVIGVDVSPARLDILPHSASMRPSNDRNGHDRPTAPAREKNVLVCFEAADRPLGQGSPRKASASAGILPSISGAAVSPAERFAKTDRNDAKTIASFMRFRPDAGRELPSAAPRELRAHVAIRARIVEAGKRPERGRVRGACSTT